MKACWCAEAGAFLLHGVGLEVVEYQSDRAASGVEAFVSTGYDLPLCASKV